eukprot:Amastigsp_a340100_34.p3 type:complete len:258 gc:universal Amastigsp_a340100_34:2319-1546(-)
MSFSRTMSTRCAARSWRKQKQKFARSGPQYARRGRRRCARPSARTFSPSPLTITAPHAPATSLRRRRRIRVTSSAPSPSSCSPPCRLSISRAKRSQTRAPGTSHRSSRRFRRSRACGGPSATAPRSRPARSGRFSPSTPKTSLSSSASWVRRTLRSRTCASACTSSGGARARAQTRPAPSDSSSPSMPSSSTFAWRELPSLRRATRRRRESSSAGLMTRSTSSIATATGAPISPTSQRSCRPSTCPSLCSRFPRPSC